MKKVFRILFFLFFFHSCWSQKAEKYSLHYRGEKLEKVLAEVETKFDIRYSYLDSLVSGALISVPKKRYSLLQINAEISRQTSLKITAVNSRFYAISKEVQLPLQLLDEIIVEGFLAKGIDKTTEKFTIQPQKIEAFPGVTEADVLLSLQQLPGVKSPNETASGLHVRGGTSDQNLVLWDGIRLYHPGHLFGMISGINPNVKQTVHFYNKAASPKFGERISSIIDIKTTDKIAEKTNVNIGANALNADAYLQLPLLKDKLGLQFSARKSYTEWVRTPTFTQLAEKVFQHTDFDDFNSRNQFEFQDYSVKVNYNPTPNTQISATALVIDNDLDFSHEVPGGIDSSQMMDIQNYGYSLNWTQRYGKKLTQKTVAFYSLYDFDYEKKQQYSPTQFEAFKKLNRIIDSGVEVHFSYAVNQKLQFDFGYQALGNDVSHLFNSYNQDIGIDLSMKHLYTVSQVGYGLFKYDFGSWNVSAGGRYNHYQIQSAQRFEPRVLLQKHFSDFLVWQISYEQKSQILSQVRESNSNDLSLENYVWVLSENKDYPVQSASQFTTGFTFKKRQWLIDVDAYYKTIDGITTLAFGFSNVNDSFNKKGNGFTKGLDLLLQKSGKTWRAWTTYTFQDSQHRFEVVNEGGYFPLNTSIRHALNLSFNKKWEGFSLAAGWFWHSGKPYSELNPAGQVTDFNSQSLPAYHRLDLSAAYEVFHKNENTLKIGFSVYNAYNNHVVISREFERSYLSVDDFITPRYAVRDYYSLGITPNVFVRMGF